MLLPASYPQSRAAAGKKKPLHEESGNQVPMTNPARRLNSGLSSLTRNIDGQAGDICHGM